MGRSPLSGLTRVRFIVIVARKGEMAELAEGGTLLRCCTRKGTEGSNPSLSAIFAPISPGSPRVSDPNPHQELSIKSRLCCDSSLPLHLISLALRLLVRGVRCLG